MAGRVLLAMSGGVDSSVAAWLLLESGYEVLGVFMRTGATFEEKETCAVTSSGSPALPVLQPARARKQGCCSVMDAHDARRVADRLGIPFYALDFEPDFRRVMDYFVREYRAGRTPNPCVMCNHWIKFGRLWDFARTVGADYVATGHYARIEYHDEDPSEPYWLMRGRDLSKDQSYVLFGLPRETLKRTLFPVGRYTKPQIREFARGLGLRVADKPDSQEICFVPENDHMAFIRRYSPGVDTSGEIVDVERGVVGRHDGYEQFTIGQRKGLGVALGGRRYVLAIDPETRRVIIGPRDYLFKERMVVRQVNWLTDPPETDLVADVKIRYHHVPAPATVQVTGEAEVTVRFHEPQSAITPGQAAVFYAGDRVLGGGIIDAVED